MFLLNLVKTNKTLYSCLFIIIILCGVYFSYQYLPQTYFASDEWYHYFLILKYGPFNQVFSVGLVGMLTGATRTLGFLSDDLFMYLFGLNIKPFLITFLVFHLINIFLLYKILIKFKLSPFSAFLSSFYFAIASAGQQALSWPAAGMQVLGSTLFILMTILLTINFKNSKKNVFLILAILCSYISFLWKPTGIVTPLLIISLIILFYKEIHSKQFLKIITILGIGTISLGLYRLLIEYSNKMSYLVKAVFDVIFFPIVSISHIFIPYRLMNRLCDWFINFYYPPISKGSNFEVVSHYIVSDYISIIISLFILFFIYILYKRINKYDKKILLFGLIVFFIQYIPLSFFYIDRRTSYIDSRYMYSSVIGISVILGVLFNFILTRFKNIGGLKRYLYFGLLLLIGFWLYKEMLVTRREVLQEALDDIVIKKTWDSLKSLKLPNSNKLVIFLKSDRSYWYTGNLLPLKQSAAYMLSLAFYGKPFIDKSVLGELNYNNTFINSNNKQFGYFTDINLLIPLVKRGEINISDIVGLHFIDKTDSFEIITDEIHKLIENNLR